ncbi:hypothetical protein [Streptomyces flavofungini]|uniref:hypothetical protein n=1 Tax=Streptomyces flavofungini TaxID=68200 RepID=UPI001991CAFE|nr:hypothetical protein [Streptomyces flavofungini]GHC89639.1 hypothetical protein GCM10010349_77700 [Streptomyces flavofungini]
MRIRSEQLVVTDGGVTTTAASSAMYDFALRLVREHDGPRVARATARDTLLDDARSAQSACVDLERLSAVGSGFSLGVNRWLDQNLTERSDLPGLALAFQVSIKTMLRRFRDEASQTPLEYLHTAEYLHTVLVRRARHLLETTERTIASISADVG